MVAQMVKLLLYTPEVHGFKCDCVIYGSDNYWWPARAMLVVFAVRYAGPGKGPNASRPASEVVIHLRLSLPALLVCVLRPRAMQRGVRGKCLALAL